ncbi:MAG: NAD(P)-dependent oxidoreductase, partial [Rhodobacteraceae bacterium]|nr:NAD(P)-dependent oxidoreductase [Paracoccaceae bacterium]
MATPQNIGLIGVGLMGHGIGKNILAKGYKLNVMANRNRAPVDSLVGKGATEYKNPRGSGRRLRGDPHRGRQFQSARGHRVPRGRHYLAGLKKGAIMADCTTAMPESTVKIAAAVQAKAAA